MTPWLSCPVRFADNKMVRDLLAFGRSQPAAVKISAMKACRTSVGTVVVWYAMMRPFWKARALPWTRKGADGPL